MDSYRSPLTTRGPADGPAPYREWSSRGRWVAPLGSATELQASVDGFHDWRTRGTDFSADRTNGADASVRLIGRGQLAVERARLLAMAQPAQQHGQPQRRTRFGEQSAAAGLVPSRGLGGSVEVRPPMPAGVELRLGADARRTNGETRELANYVAGNPTRRRKAGGESWTSGAYAEASAELGSIDGQRRRADRSLANRRRSFVRADYRQRRGHRGTNISPAATDGCRPRAAASLAPIGGGFSLRSAAYLGWRMPTLNELFRPFRAGTDATAANPDLDPERLAGAEAGLEFARGPLRLSLTAFVNRLSDAIANVTLGQRARHLPAGRLRRGRRRIPPASECRCGEGPRS